MGSGHLSQRVEDDDDAVHHHTHAGDDDDNDEKEQEGAEERGDLCIGEERDVVIIMMTIREASPTYLPRCAGSIVIIILLP